MNIDLSAELALHQTESEKLFAGAVMMNEDLAREVCGSVKPYMFVDPVISEFWAKVQNGEDPAQAAIDLRAYFEFVQYQNRVPTSNALPAYAKTIQNDFLLRQGSMTLSAMAQAAADGKIELFTSLAKTLTFNLESAAPKDDQPDRFQIRGMDYAMLPQGEREWRVKGLIAVGNVGLFSAWTGSGKTWLMYELLVSHALGKPWMDFETVQGTSLLVNEEMDEYDLNLRLAMCNRAKFGDENTPLKYISFARFNLFSDKTAVKDALALEQKIIETGASLVVIDALADIMQGGNENAVEDTQGVFMRLSEIAKRTRSAIIVIHHTGKNGATRGSSAIPGAVDIGIKATRSEDSPFMAFETEKARITSAAKWVCKMVWTPDQFYSERFYPEQAPAKFNQKEEGVIEYLDTCNQKRATTKEITGATGVTRYVVIGLANKGAIKRVETGKGGKDTTYEMCDV